MTRIIDLLMHKNHYLENFYATNEEALEQFRVGDFASIEEFYQTRERILDNVRYIDSELNKAQEEISGDIESEARQEVRRHLAIKDEYVSRILEQDLEILACIEKAKSQIIRELRDIQKSKRAVSGYKTKSFSHRLNEEA